MHVLIYEHKNQVLQLATLMVDIHTELLIAKTFKGSQSHVHKTVLNNLKDLKDNCTFSSQHQSMYI